MDQRRVNEELERILADSRFVQSKRLTDFLTFVVKTRLADSTQPISEYTIADEVFCKAKSFDPTIDSIVRVTAGRLRAALASFYSEEGETSPVKIIIPAGSYTPDFVFPDVSESEENAPITFNRTVLNLTHSKAVIFTTICAMAVLTIWLVGHMRSHYAVDETNFNLATPIAEIESYPTLAVLPFENLTNENRFNNLEQGFQRQIVRDLFSFGTLKIEQIDTPVKELTESGASPYDFAIKGQILQLEPDTQIFVSLTDINSGKIIKEIKISKPGENQAYFSVLADISNDVVNRILGRQGELLHRKIQDIEERINNNSLILGELSAFECYAMFEHYQDEITLNNFVKSRDCIDAELKRNPKDATMLAAKTYLGMEIAFLNLNPILQQSHPAHKHLELDPSITFETTMALAKKAAELEPNNSVALMMLADHQRFNRDFLSAEFTLRQILEINPGNAEAIAYYGIIQNLLGNFDQGYSLGLEALARSQNPESYYYASLLQNALARQDLDDLKAHIEPFRVLNDHGKYFYLMYKAGISILEDETETIKSINNQLESFCEVLDHDIFKGLKDNITPTQTIESLEALFLAANVRPCEPSLKIVAESTQ